MTEIPSLMAACVLSQAGCGGNRYKQRWPRPGVVATAFPAAADRPAPGAAPTLLELEIRVQLQTVVTHAGLAGAVGHVDVPFVPEHRGVQRPVLHRGVAELQHITLGVGDAAAEVRIDELAE